MISSGTLPCITMSYLRGYYQRPLIFVGRPVLSNLSTTFVREQGFITAWLPSKMNLIIFDFVWFVPVCLRVLVLIMFDDGIAILHIDLMISCGLLIGIFSNGKRINYLVISISKTWVNLIPHVRLRHIGLNLAKHIVSYAANWVWR